MNLVILKYKFLGILLYKEVFFFTEETIIAIRIKKKYQGRQREVNNDKINEQIRAPQLLVIVEQGEKPVQMSNKDAQAKSEEMELDLVLVTDKGEMPVVRIVDYGKFKYERKKKEQERKRQQVIVENKEVRLTPRIGQHDLEVKIKQAIKFLEKGNRVKVSMKFRGRENQNMEQGLELIEQFLESVSEYGTVDKKPVKRGIFYDVNLKPVAQKK